MDWQLSGKLEISAGERPSFAGCRIEAFFDRLLADAPDETDTAPPTTEDTETDDAGDAALVRAIERGLVEAPTDAKPPAAALTPRPFRVSVLADRLGRFTMTLPDRKEIASSTIAFEVSSPIGKVIADKPMALAALGEALNITVSKFETTVLKPPAKTPAAPPLRVQGRVIDRAGKCLPPCLQVLLLARKDDEAPLAPILATKADASGYFYGEIPNQPFVQVTAVVSGAADVEVRLVDGLVPAQLPLVVEMAAAGKDSAAAKTCGCGPAATPRTPTQEEIAAAPGTFSADLGGGQCVRFNVPNRAIEEFDFYSVVRTTQPDIMALTVEMAKDDPVELPTAPVDADWDLTSGETPSGSTGGDPTVANTIDFIIRNRLLVVLNAAVGVTFLPDWSVLEANIRVGVSDGRGTPLPFDFFRQFPGWGLGTRWSFGTTFSAVDINRDPLDSIVKKAAAFGAGVATTATRTAAIAERQPRLRPAAPPAGAASNLAGIRKSAALDIYKMRRLPRAPRRVPLDKQAPIDWDSTPTFYEAASIAHGHLLHFKQVWYADGYSLGDLLYSLPLAPGQKKLIAVVDWERREQTSRTEFGTAGENVQAALSKDRDLTEVVTGALSEASRGGSRNTTVGAGVGTGAAGNGSYQQFSFGALIGVSGGVGESEANAFQTSSREVAATSVQNLRDRTLQSASAIRSLRTSIVQTARQGEAVRATTEVIANHNHCHALTIQYFEVLRHLKVTHELVDVQECLFVPLPMIDFTRPMVLRWRQALSRYLQRPELAPAFDATRRVQTSWSDSETALARYADEIVSAVFGELTVTLIIPLPPFPEKPKPKPEDTVQDTINAVGNALNPTEGFLGAVLAVATGGASLLAGAAIGATSDVVKATTQGARGLTESLFTEPTAEERYARFQQEVMPAAAVGFVDQLELYALVGANEVRLNGADFTLVSNYQPGTPLLVSVRGRITNPIRRASIASIIIKSGAPLPPGCRAIVNSANLQYQTRLFRHDLVNDTRVNDDIDLPIVAYTGLPTLGLPPPPTPPIPMPFPLPGFPNDWNPIPGMTPLRGGNGATLYTALDEWEQRSPRREDLRLSTELVEHLNANLEFYHHAIWWTMDPNRRFMLLDGYVAPNADGRSLASVVDNTLIGIVGNSLILPVARGNHLDPTFSLADNVTLLQHYSPQSPPPPARVSLPTRGVFAEAVMGDCNACEEIDDTRFWRWDEVPIDEPPPLDVAALGSRRSQPSYGTPTPFPAPIVGMQASPQAPDPAGVAAALTALGKQSFPDITGLAGTQANAAAAFSKAMDTALAFGKEASTLAQQASMTKNIGQTMRAIDKAEGDNKIDPSSAKQLRTTALKSMAGDAPNDPKASSVADRLGVIDDQVSKGTITQAAGSVLRTDVMKALSPDDEQQRDAAAAATKLIDEIPRDTVTSIETADTKIQTAADTVGRAEPDLDRLEREFAGRTPGLIARLSDAPDFTLFNFAVNSTDLKRFDAVLNNFGSFFSDLRDRGYNADIVGVASVSGSERHNAELSFARALAIQNLYERRFAMPAQRMNARQLGARMSPPPPDVLEQFAGEDQEAVWRAWNRRVEIHAVADPWTGAVYDRIITFLGTPDAPVASDIERQRAIDLATLLKDSSRNDLYITSYPTLVMSIDWFWNRDPLFNTMLMNPARWDQFTFASHVRVQLAKSAQPNASDLVLTTQLVSMLRQMALAADNLNRYVTIQQEGGSGVTIHDVIQRAYMWIGEQSQDEDSVYSVLAQ